MFGRRVGIATVVAGTAFAATVGLSGPASAADKPDTKPEKLYQNDNANVYISGGEAIALNACIADTDDGVVTTQKVACNQIGTSGNLVTLDHVAVWVTTSGVPPKVEYKNSDATVSVSGGLAASINLCVADAKDGVITDQQVACNQVATAGNLTSLSNVWVQVTDKAADKDGGKKDGGKGGGKA